MRVQQLILSEIYKHSEVKEIDNGALWCRGEDVTKIQFSNSAIHTEIGRCSVVTIETLFGPRFKAPNAYTLARINRRSCYGSYFVVDQRLVLKASYSLYENDPATNWVISALLQCFGDQLAFGVANVHSIVDPSALAAHRANLEYPRSWQSEVNLASAVTTADRLTERGWLSSVDGESLFAEVSLDDGPRSRMIDINAETALVRVSSGVRHPIAGVGFASTIAIPIDPERAEIPIWAKRLNDAEHELIDFVPRLGAWGERSLGSHLVYSMFWPTTEYSDALLGNLANWMIQRCLWVKETYWKSNVGLLSA